MLITFFCPPLASLTSSFSLINFHCLSNERARKNRVKFRSNSRYRVIDTFSKLNKFGVSGGAGELQQRENETRAARTVEHKKANFP